MVLRIVPLIVFRNRITFIGVDQAPPYLSRKRHRHTHPANQRHEPNRAHTNQRNRAGDTYAHTNQATLANHNKHIRQTRTSTQRQLTTASPQTHTSHARYSYHEDIIPAPQKADNDRDTTKQYNIPTPITSKFVAIVACELHFGVRIWNRIRFVANCAWQSPWGLPAKQIMTQLIS